jgi:protein-L-isoaspartate(D-aspartate) O-methyltransferase
LLTAPDHPLRLLLRECAEPIDDIESVGLDSLVERVAQARVVLIGEASHGTSEFYRMRARITRELVHRAGFDVIAVEADWPDAARIDRYVRHLPPLPGSEPAFTRFPTWMWRNREVAEFAEWLRLENADRDPSHRVSFRGLDLYSMYSSIQAVLHYLDEVDPAAAAQARQRYACLDPWTRDPGVYGRLAVSGRARKCEGPVVEILTQIIARRLADSVRDGELLFEAERNAAVVASAEQYYRLMYYGRAESWNLRDSHMFDTLSRLLQFRGPDARAVVWAHNSHVGDARATELGWNGELNLGQLCRHGFGSATWIVGFGTDHGTVAAASEWDGPMAEMAVRPALAGSYEALCHETGLPAFLLSLRQPPREALADELEPNRLERAIGVIYRPETERASHYFEASLPNQFDEYVWFDRSSAVRPLPGPSSPGVPETYPFGL